MVAAEESMVTGEDERERAAITESGGESGGKESLIPSIFLFLCVCEMRGGDKTN